MNNFAIFYQRNEDTENVNTVSYFPMTVPGHRVESEVQRLESEGYCVTAVIQIFDLVNFE